MATSAHQAAADAPRSRTRIAVLVVLVLAAVVIAAVVLLGKSSDYRVKAEFISASQLVKGNLVNVAGEPVGTVESIELTPNSQAVVELTVNKDYAPLRQGTRAIIRQASLSSVANRYVDLQLGGADGAEIPNGGRIGTVRTESSVEIDQIFNTFDDKTRAGFRGTIGLFKDFNAGREDEANAALRYLAPSLASTTRLFGELNRNTPDLERFIDETSKLVTDVAARDDELAGFISNLSTTQSAVARERDDLGRGLETLPRFMRRANTTFVNLRSTLDELDPLVAESRPVVRERLRPLFAELRPFAAAADPTVRDLSRTIRRPGERNDLIEFLQAQRPVDRIANDTARRNGKDRPGAFATTRRALDGATPQLGFFRPYTTDLVGWFDDFSSSGAYDALGNFSRSGLQLNQFSITPVAGSTPTILPVPPELRDDLFEANVDAGRNNRCPGSIERPVDGSNPYKPTPDFNCDLRQQPIGR